MSRLKSSILKASLPHIKAHSFTLQAVQKGLADSSSSPLSSSLTSQDQQTYLLTNVFGDLATAERELVKAWEDEGIHRMSTPGDSQTETMTKQTLKQVLRRRLAYTEETAGEHVVQAHAIIQSPAFQPFSLSLPGPVARTIDHVQSGSQFEPYLPPQAGSPRTTSSTLVSSSSSTMTSVESDTRPRSHNGTETTPHHLPFPLPPNPFRSYAYAWKIADEAIHLSALPFALNQNPGQGNATTNTIATRTDGGKAEVLRMGQGQGWEWYIRRGVLSSIFLRAESILMQPRPMAQDSTTPLDQALARLDYLLDHSYESTVRRLTLRSSGGKDGEGSLGSELGTFGWFVWKSWGGLFRSRGWIN